MQQQIPDDLGQELAKLAEGLKLDLDEAVRQALESWIKRVRQSRVRRMPDACVIEGEEGAPFDLPRSTAHAVQVIRGRSRVPDGVGLG